MKKEELRQLFRNKRDSLPEKTRNFLSLKVFKKIVQWQVFSDSHIIMTFVSFGSEIDTHRLIKYCLENGKKIVIPKANKKERKLITYLINKFPDDLEIGNYGILEPRQDNCKIIDMKKIDLIFVPGLVFDKNGYRIGYGKGYFDNFLKEFGKHTITCGLCFSFQVMDKINHQKWDKQLEFILNEKSLIKCKQ